MPDCLLLRILGIYGALRPATALTLTNSILRLRKPRLAPFEGSQDFSIGKSGAAESVKTVAEKGGEIVQTHAYDLFDFPPCTLPSRPCFAVFTFTFPAIPHQFTGRFGSNLFLRRLGCGSVVGAP